MNSITHQIRCPECNARLFDLISEKNHVACIGNDFTVLIKCWKCHKTITLGKIDNYDYLVQASHVYLQTE